MWHERLPLLWGVEVKGSTVSKRGGEEGDYRIGIRRHYLKFTQTELKFLTQLIILFSTYTPRLLKRSVLSSVLHTPSFPTLRDDSYRQFRKCRLNLFLSSRGLPCRTRFSEFLFSTFIYRPVPFSSDHAPFLSEKISQEF